MDCNKCKYINITESKQQKQNKSQKKAHRCLKYNKRVLHRDYRRDHHPELVPCEECNQFIAWLVNLVK